MAEPELTKWTCYFHEGPCALVKKKNGVQLERHANSRFAWWEIYDSTQLKTFAFQKRCDAFKKFEEMVGERKC
jgi:hypothetical protein